MQVPIMIMLSLTYIRVQKRLSKYVPSCIDTLKDEDDVMITDEDDDDDEMKSARMSFLH